MLVGKLRRGTLSSLRAEKPEIELRGPPVGLDDAIKAFVKAKGKNVLKKKGYYWYREKSGVAEVFNSVKKIMGEMGASAKLV